MWPRKSTSHWFKVTLPIFIFCGKVMCHDHPDEDDQQGGDDEHGDGAPPHKDNLTKKQK